MSTLLLLLGIYLLYRFIADFVIPVYRTSKRVQEQFRNMQQQRPDADSPGRTPYSNTSAGSQPKAGSRDYIDFEEVKD